MVKGEWFMVSHSTFTRKIWKLRKNVVSLQQKHKNVIIMCTITLSYNEKDYTPEELRTLLISDLNSLYGVRDAV